ncbi:hypothetical protein SRHO_G00189530 [Serrasalmus rhombeus]
MWTHGGRRRRGWRVTLMWMSEPARREAAFVHPLTGDRPSTSPTRVLLGVTRNTERIQRAEQSYRNRVKERLGHASYGVSDGKGKRWHCQPLSSITSREIKSERIFVQQCPGGRSGELHRNGTECW